MENSSRSSLRLPNILLMLADDLGYSDLSVPPFTKEADSNWPCSEGGILSPNLEKMAMKGVTMTNFHSASPVCSPSRAAVMTGLYPWRLTAMNAFELGRDLSQRNGFLPQIPTVAEILRERGYYTAHSGKWHLGSMREEMRRDRVYRDVCSRPGPNQHGFEEYVSELDGPESPRYTFLNGQSTLHSKGHRHLIKDDVPMPIVDPPNGTESILSDREASDAIKLMEKLTRTSPHQPWYIQVWFNAPHGPWELLKAGEEVYNQKYGKQSSDWATHRCNLGKSDERLLIDHGVVWKYRSMVSAMDRSIGMLLDAVNRLGIEQDTLVVFTSDNGQENGAGSAHPFREGKRSLMEGGVRVPTIWQWTGHFPGNSYTNYFAGNTDLLPTFLDAADVLFEDRKSNGLSSQHHPDADKLKVFVDTLRFDGVSLLPVLQHAIPIRNITDKTTLDVNNFDYQAFVSFVPGEEDINRRYFHMGDKKAKSIHVEKRIARHDKTKSLVIVSGFNITGSNGSLETVPSNDFIDFSEKGILNKTETVAVGLNSLYALLAAGFSEQSVRRSVLFDETDEIVGPSDLMNYLLDWYHWFIPHPAVVKTRQLRDASSTAAVSHPIKSNSSSHGSLSLLTLLASHSPSNASSRPPSSHSKAVPSKNSTATRLKDPIQSDKNSLLSLLHAAEKNHASTAVGNRTILSPPRGKSSQSIDPNSLFGVSNGFSGVRRLSSLWNQISDTVSDWFNYPVLARSDVFEADNVIENDEDHSTRQLNTVSLEDAVSHAVTSRIFLWHKDTDAFCCHQQPMQSAGYYDDIKLISLTAQGCLDSIYDMRMDPTEQKNLLPFKSRQNCQINFDKFDVKLLQSAIPHQVGKEHCETLLLKGKIVLDQLAQMKHHTEEDEKVRHRIQSLITGMSSGGTSMIDVCGHQYYKALITRVFIIMKKLSVFAKYGNAGHRRYMRYDIDRATCNVPVASEAILLHFNDSTYSDCARLGCSQPDY